MNWKKGNIQQEAQMKKLLSLAGLVDEKDEEDYEIELLIRNGYEEGGKKLSHSQEIAIHRKKLMGAISDEEWQEYVDFVAECIRRVRERKEAQNADSSLQA